MEVSPEMVLAEDFLKDNYLSNDVRVPVDVLGTEICSSMASNALEGHLWDNFASETYWNLPAIGEVELFDPVGDRRFAFNARGGGRGYQRVPSLISIWSTAPLLHKRKIISVLGFRFGSPSPGGCSWRFNGE